MTTSTAGPAHLSIQLAVQGGGARLADLIAALDAVQRLDDDDIEAWGQVPDGQRLKVTRLSGTSAGAIAAALFAARIDLKTVKQRICDSQDKLLRLAPAPTKLHQKAFALWRILRGRPVVDITPLRTLLRKELVHPKTKHTLRFRDLLNPPLLPLTVVATDLTNRRTVEFSPELTPEEVVADAVADSMALPIYFRLHDRSGSGPLRVDGGVCENFPVDVLRAFEDSCGPVIGVTFAPPPHGDSPRSLPAFALSLLLTAMENSVRRAQRLLGDERLLQLSPRFELLAFKEAIEDGLKKGYGDPYYQSLEFFRQLVSSRTLDRGRIIEARSLLDESGSMMQRAADLFRAQHERVTMRYHEIVMIVKLGARQQPSNGGTGTVAMVDRAPDQMWYRLKFSAADQPLACARISVTDEPTTEFLRTYRKAVFDKNGRPVRTIDLLARDQSMPKDRAYLLFFDPVILPGSDGAPFLLEYYQQATRMMEDFFAAEKRRDFLAVHTNRAHGPTERVILIAYVPDSHPGARLVASPRTTAAQRGRALTEPELIQLGHFVEAGYYAVGWVGEDVEAEVQFAAELVDGSGGVPHSS